MESSDKKIVLIGDSGVGKTSILQRYIFETFDPYNPPTLGAGFRTKVIDLGNDRKVRLQIWDTAGQEKFKGITKMYYRDAHIAIVVYDSGYYESFKSTKNWVKELRENGNAQMDIVIAGNKCDLDADKKVPLNESLSYAQSIDGKFYEISAKNNIGIDDMFKKISRKLQ